jgi:hypothetical protein
MGMGRGKRVGVARRGLLGHQGLKDLLVLMGVLEHKGSRGFRASKAHRAPLAPKVIPVLLAPKGIRASKV